MRHGTPTSTGHDRKIKPGQPSSSRRFGIPKQVSPTSDVLLAGLEFAEVLELVAEGAGEFEPSRQVPGNTGMRWGRPRRCAPRPSPSGQTRWVIVPPGSRFARASVTNCPDAALRFTARLFPVPLPTRSVVVFPGHRPAAALDTNRPEPALRFTVRPAMGPTSFVEDPYVSSLGSLRNLTGRQALPRRQDLVYPQGSPHVSRESPDRHEPDRGLSVLRTLSVPDHTDTIEHGTPTYCGQRPPLTQK